VQSKHFSANSACYLYAAPLAYVTHCKHKSWVQYFLMQVVMNKCFLLNPAKNLAQFEKNAKMTQICSEKITSQSRRLGYFINPVTG